MRDDFSTGAVAELKNMREMDFAEINGVSRNTARKARNAALSEFGENRILDNS